MKAQRRALRREGKAITKAEGDDSIDLTGVTDTETDTDTLGETDTTMQEGSTGTDYYSRNESWLHSRATGKMSLYIAGIFQTLWGMKVGHEFIQHNMFSFPEVEGHVTWIYKQRYDVCSGVIVK